MKIKLSKVQWEQIGKLAGWTGKNGRIKTSSVMKLSSSEAMISQFMTSMQNGTLKLDDLLSPSKSHPEVSHVIDILKKKGVNMSLLLSEAEQVYDHKNGPFNRQSFLSFLYHNPVGQKLKPTIISLMRTANDPQRSEYLFNRNDPKHPIVM